MKKTTTLSLIAAVIFCVLATACSTASYSSSTTRNSSHYARTTAVSYNEYTMDLDEYPVEYTIDISTIEGKTKLANLTLEDAENLALVEAIMQARCATLFQPQYTHLMKDGHVLRVTVYGIPARYKRKN